MTSDMINKDIFIDAPAETVYRVLTEPEQISRWFADAAELDPVAGGAGTLTFEARATTERTVVKLTVEAAEPPHRFAFRWDNPDGEEPTEANSLLVEFTLTAEGTGTRLRVTESGFDALERAGRDMIGYYEAHEKGWEAHLANLRGYVTGQS
jgi:uncharacterized protein YndB with AHSA1/START domain